MTRFQTALVIAAILCVVALALGWFVLCGIIVAVFVLIIGLGVTLPQLSLFGRFICHGNDSRRCVAITFDDGPDPRSTPALLDLLRDERVPAAFFCVGKRVAAERDLAARMVREGHLLESHSYGHSNATNFFTTTRLREELALNQALIHQATGIAPRYFRPPMGLSNPRVFQAARLLGLTVVGWSARGFDTQVADPARIVSRIARRLAPGAIILLHDGNLPADKVVATVKSLLDTLRTLGYEVVRLDKLLA